MERVQKQQTKQSVKRRAGRGLAFLLAIVMVFQVTVTPVDAFSLGGFFKKVSNTISNTVKSIQKIVDTSSSKTVYSYSELNSFLCSLFAPKDIKVKLGADIYVPSNRTIASALHNVDMDMNGHTIYSDNPGEAIIISYGRTFNISGGIRGGTIVQRVNTSNGVIDMTGGDATITNVTIRKSGSASRVTGLDISGILASPQITFDNVTFDGMTTGLNIEYGGRVVMKNSSIKNSQGDAVNICGRRSYNQKYSELTMTGGSIKYFKGNGINAGSDAKVTLTDVTVTGGTTRNRYGILAGKGATVNLKGSTKVYSSAGGNIGVYRGCPVQIDTLSAENKYSFTVVDGLNGTAPSVVAELTTAYLGDIRSLPAYSDISRYMVRGNENNTKIQIQNPPAQCNVKAELYWNDTKAAKAEDTAYATLSVNGGAEATSGSAIVKYDAKVTLSTTNNNPARYKFLGWYKYVDGSEKVLVSSQPTCQVEVFDEHVTYKAEYQYMQYTITVVGRGKGSVTGGGTYYVDDEVILTATPNPDEIVGDKTTTYGFNKWNDGVTATTRTITVTKDETYIGMFKKTGQTTGTLYLGLKEITGTVPTNKDLLLVYVGKGCEDNRMETGATGTNVAITGLPEGSAKMRLATADESNEKAPSNSSKGNYTFIEGKANYYGYKYGSIADATTADTTCVHWDEKAADFDDCNPGFIRKETINGQDCWLYWCWGGYVQAAGPYVLYSYDQAIDFNMNTVTLKMNPDFKPTTAEDTVNSSAIIAVATASDGKEYTLGGLKFGDESKGLDNKINYREGDKTIALELDGITCDYDFPEATINGKQYTKLSDAITAANVSATEDAIQIVGPGVDMIDVTTPVNLAEGDKIEGYDHETVRAVSSSSIGVDKNGTVRLTNGTLDVDPVTASSAAIGVKDAFAKTDKKIRVTTTDGGKNSVIVPEAAETTLQISPDNNPEHLVTINEAGGNGKTYEFDNIPSYAGENVKIGKETEYTVNIPGSGTASGTAIKTSKYNTGDTTITDGGDGDDTVRITSSKEGDKVTVGDNTYETGKTQGDQPTTYRVNPDQTQEPSVILEQGSLGIPKDTTIEVKDTIVKNTGATSGGAVTAQNPVQISASGEIDIPDGAGVTINGVQIQVPAATPMNGNTTVTLDDKGKPTIRTTGDSEVKLVVNGKETTYQVGDYDAVLTIGTDDIPVIEDGEIRLQPGQTIKDRLGNEYRCPESATEGITIMTTPLVYETDDKGKPILVGGGDMSFVLPADTGIECKPKGSSSFQTFTNPGGTEGFFNLDPERAADGIQADSELTLAAGKTINLSAGDQSITVKAPDSGNGGEILVDGSTGRVTLTKTGDTVIIDGKTYTAKADNTVFIIDEDGVTLAEGSGAAEQGKALNAEGLAITGGTGRNSMAVTKGTDTGDGNTKIQTSGKTEFTIAPVGKEDTKVTFVTGEGPNSYPVGIDGSITLPHGESISRKSGTSQVEIKASGNADITMKPLAKASKGEITDGESTPVGGLLLEVPTGSAVTIGGKTYQETTIDNGREGEEAYSLPMQLVLDEKGNVVLYSGTVELGKGADISLYDVGNQLASFKNTSENDQKVQITNPGIATMPEIGTSITMGDGKKSVEFTTTVDNTQIAYTPDLCLLKRGGVNLNPQEKILVNDMVVQNTSTGTGNKDVEVILNEVLTDGEFVTTGRIDVQNGGSFTLSSPGADKEISYQSNVEGSGIASFTINEDGNLVLPEGGIATLKDEKGTETKVQAGVADVESIPTPDGAMFAIPAGGNIVVGGVKYTNAKTVSGENSYLVLEVNQDGKVVLVKGDVELSEGAIVYVKSEEETLVPIKNTAQTASGENEGTKILVKYDGPTDVKDENDKVESTTYPKVDIQVPNGGSISIGENEYKDVSPASGQSDVQISMDIAKKSGSVIPDGKIEGDRIVLKSGTVDLGADSSIQILVPKNESSSTLKVVANIGDEDEKSVQVGSDGKIELPEGSAASVEDGNDITTIRIPSDGTDDYKAAVDIGGSDATVQVALQTKDGNGVSGAGKKVIINDDTYVSKETDKNLNLTLDTVHDQVKLSDPSTSVGLADGASIVVGDTTVTATTGTEITVTETLSGDTKVPEVDIPSGGEANFKNPKTKQDIDVKVPEKTAEEGSEANQQKFTVGADGSISTALKKDDTVVIGGVEYTGTSESDDNNTIKVNGKTGALLESPTDAAPKTAIDSELFNKTDYVYELPAGASVLVDGVEYQAGAGSAIKLCGNPNGKPIVRLQSAGDQVVIGGKTYTAAAADTRFVLNEGNKITLIDNGQPDMANSSLTIQGKDKVNIAGVTFSGKTDDDSYTVTYHSDGSYVSVADGTKLLVDMPTDSKIYVAGQGAVETKDETGAAVTRTFTGPIPVTMNGGSGSVYLDKTKEELTDTAFVQIVGLKDVEILYDTASEETPTVQGIVVRPKQIINVPDFGGETEKPSAGDQQNINSIPVTGDTGVSEVTIPVVVEENKVIVDTITTEVVEQLINTEAEGTKVVSLDCTALEKPVIVLDTVTVGNMSEKVDQIKIITASAEIEIDKQAAEAILEQAVGNKIEIKVNAEQTDILNQAQQKTLKNYQVTTCLDAFVESSGVRIHDFRGGKVKVSIPWDVEKGKKAVYYHVYYLDTYGAMDIYDTVYEAGKLWFETEHFSEYVIVYDDELLNATPVDQSPVLASVTKVGKTSLRLKWNSVEGADQYIIYAAKCNTALKSYKLKKVATVSSTKNTYVLKNLKAGTKYKIVVKAVGDGTKLKQSKTLHVATKGGKYTNAEKLTVSPTKLVLKAGKTKKLKVSYLADRYAVRDAAIVRYVSSNSEIAAVTAKGKIKAKRAGTCKVYALLCSGEYVVITVTVK